MSLLFSYPFLGWYRRAMARYKEKTPGNDVYAAIRRLKASLLFLQRVTRGYLHRNYVSKLKIKVAVDYYSATVIQRIFRGSRILHWKDLRMNLISAYILDRHIIERKDRKNNAVMRYKYFLQDNRKDSASESEEEEREKSPWVKSRDYKKGRGKFVVVFLCGLLRVFCMFFLHFLFIKLSSIFTVILFVAVIVIIIFMIIVVIIYYLFLYFFFPFIGTNFWTNILTGEIVYDEPFEAFTHEKAMINKRVRIYWIVQKEWYEGEITVFNSKKLRHKVHYDDNDYEWIDLDKECDRVQVYLSDGSWIMVSNVILLLLLVVVVLLLLLLVVDDLLDVYNASCGYVYIFIRVSMYGWMCMYACMYMHIFIYFKL